MRKPNKRKRVGSNTALKIIKSVIESQGIDVNSEGAKQLISDGVDKLFATWETNRELIQVRIEHDQALLAQGRLFHKHEEDVFACIFFAIWVEHTLNAFVLRLASKHNMDNSNIEAMIRDSQYKAKSSWLLLVLGAKPFPKVHQNRIIRLMELRNSYIHYKWKAAPIEKAVNEYRETHTFLSEFERTITYMKKYSAKYVDNLTLRKVKRVLNSSDNGEFD